ncbi:ribonucleotide reductase of class Ib (aerobic), alpha subunit [Staphylococcus phage Twort]|uniref:Ribonucleoside-diphosphate reductase n=2 Tax=Staphylococcus phage Twort (strain DSM 17442 / HER 48) TaxID=2908167 RepID=A0A6H0X5E5_BPTWO|nr:ribonucleotide reductase of class Ib (aerobic), alpha subunit [Staphylococcus phage Twort]
MATYGKWIDLNNEVTQLDENGKNKLYKDKEALEEYSKYIEKNTRNFDNEVERVRTLTKEGTYDKVFDSIPDTIIEEMTKLAYSFNFQFQSFMACQKFYESYAVTQYDKDDNPIFVEDYEQHNVRVALYLFQDDYVKAREMLIQLMEQTLQPATPVYLNSGLGKRGELSSCYLFIVDDTIESINFITDSVRQASKNAGGCAVDLTRLRPRGTEVNGVPNASKGVIPFAKNIEQSVSYFNQGKGKREGSAVCYLNIFHPDIHEFLSSKKINASDKVRLDTLSIGVTIPNKFMELLKEDKYYYTFNVYDVKQKYGFTLNEINMSEYYDIFVNDDDIRKEKYYTRDIMTDIARTQLESGYPYVFYIDNANDNHPLKKLGKVQMSNLCCEVTQLQEVSDIFPYLQSHNDTIGNDVVCTLGSLNLVNVVEKGLLKESVDSGIRSLSKVTDLMNVPFLPSVQKANDELRAIGLGAMNWHGLLAKNMLSYGSRESLDIANSLFSAIRYYSIKSSMELAKETGKVFKGFKESEYYTGEVFSSYIQKSHEPRTKKAKKVLEKVYIPTEEDWNSLSKDVKEYGMYNGYLNNLAPTQSISYVQNATSSIMPVPSPIENRRYGNMDTYYPMPFMSPITQFFYESETAYKLDNKRIINTSAVIQKHVDQAISTILYVESEIPTNKLVSLYYYAWEKGLKSLYYTRSQTLKVIECESCSV